MTDPDRPNQALTLADWNHRRGELFRVLARQLAFLREARDEYSRCFFALYHASGVPDVGVSEWIECVSETLHGISADRIASFEQVWDEENREHVFLCVPSEMGADTLQDKLDQWRFWGDLPITVLSDSQFETLAWSAPLLTEYARAMLEWVRGSNRLKFDTLPTDLPSRAREHLAQFGRHEPEESLECAFREAWRPRSTHGTEDEAGIHQLPSGAETVGTNSDQAEALASLLEAYVEEPPAAQDRKDAAVSKERNGGTDDGGVKVGGGNAKR